MSSNHGAEGNTTALPQPTPWMTRNLPPQRGMRKPRNDQVLTTRVGLQIPDVLSFEEWERAGRQLAGVVDSSSWWLGDWLTYGKDNYSDRYQQGIRNAGLRYQTLRNYAWVARRFDMSRRRARLTFQHHAEVASLPTEEQDRWLIRAEERSWTTKQLRNALREARGAEPAAATDAALFRRLTVPQERLQRWHKAAEQSGVEVAEWVLVTLDSAAEQVIDDTDEPAAATVERAVPAEAEYAVPAEGETAVQAMAEQAVPGEAEQAVPAEGETAAPAKAEQAVPTQAVPTQAVPAEGETAVPTQAVPAEGETAAPTQAVPAEGETAAPTQAVPAEGETAAPTRAGQAGQAVPADELPPGAH